MESAFCTQKQKLIRKVWGLNQKSHQAQSLSALSVMLLSGIPDQGLGRMIPYHAKDDEEGGRRKGRMVRRGEGGGGGGEKYKEVE